ncbi:iron chaperone, partial [Enterococcus faecalis]|uniref:iron chaperone n=1 Tax=Enterococcus faecalis TaxID=1351 RepID=UPI000D4AFA82
KQHLGFYPTPSAIQRFSKELRPFRTSKGAIQFPYTQELPLSLIQEIVKFRVQENMKSVGQKLINGGNRSNFFGNKPKFSKN